jgi:hypothetical protein
MTAADGRKFKPLFAPLIQDLDNRVNVNAAGNARAVGAAGPWSPNNPGTVNPANFYKFQAPNTFDFSHMGWNPGDIGLGRIIGRPLTAGGALPPPTNQMEVMSLWYGNHGVAGR